MLMIPSILDNTKIIRLSNVSEMDVSGNICLHSIHLVHCMFDDFMSFFPF